MSNADKVTELVVCILFGWLGVHKFMKGQTGLGVVYLLTFGIFGIGWLIDIITLAVAVSKAPSIPPTPERSSPPPDLEKERVLREAKAAERARIVNIVATQKPLFTAKLIKVSKKDELGRPRSENLSTVNVGDIVEVFEDCTEDGEPFTIVQTEKFSELGELSDKVMEEKLSDHDIDDLIFAVAAVNPDSGQISISAFVDSTIPEGA